MIYLQAKEIADKIVERMRPYCARIEIAGSIRRHCSKVGDIEIVYIPISCYALELFNIIDKWKKIKGKNLGKYTQRELPEGINLDLFQATFDNWGLIFAIRTGSADFSHNVLAAGWVKKGYHSEEGVLYMCCTPDEIDLDYSHPVYIRDELELFNLIGIPYVEPENRK